MEWKALVTLWDGAWQQGLWAAPWSKVLDGLTASQAEWRPHLGRHSIWQITHRSSGLWVSQNGRGQQSKPGDRKGRTSNGDSAQS